MRHSEISRRCRVVLFKQEQEEVSQVHANVNNRITLIVFRVQVWQNKVDAVLMGACRNEVARHCPAKDAGPGEILNCLKVRV